MKKLLLIIFLLSSYIAYSQSLFLFGIDESNFPKMKANIFAFENNWQQITNLSKSDFSLKEDGIERTITSISCPAPKPSDTLSSVLVIDVSGSMMGGYLGINNMEIAKNAAKTWVEALPAGSECAITSFDDFNYLNQDFTQNKNLLNSAINQLHPKGGTNYDAALINPKAGGLVISKKGKYKKVIVFLTDGQSSTTSTSQIISEANSQNCTIYCVSIGIYAPKSIKDIANQTGGAFFENVTTMEEAEAIYRTILHAAQGISPCTIEWDSEVTCKSEKINIELSLNNSSLSSNSSYIIPNDAIAKLSFNPRSIIFNNPIPGETNEQKVIVSAINADFTITDIIRDNSTFDISPKSFELKKGESIELTISYTALDSGYAICKIEFENNLCPTYLYASGGWVGIKPSLSTLKLTHPNGGEKFVVGSDTPITWEGIMPSDTVRLEYSIDNGQNWNLITNKASELEYKWTNIPKPTSDQCLVRVSQIDYNNDNSDKPSLSIIWEKTYGGSSEDYPNSIIETSDGYLIVAGYTNSDDGDIKSKKSYLRDYWILKLNPINGDIIWEKTFGGDLHDEAYSIIQAKDSYLYVAGNTGSVDNDVQSGNKGRSDCWIIKIDPSDGKIIWEKSYGGSWEDNANSIIETSDGNLVVAGATASVDGDISSGNQGFYDAWIIKINPSNGEIIWEKTFGGINSDFATSIIQTRDNNLVFAGRTQSNDGDIKSGNKGGFDYWVVKINGETAELIWEMTYGGTTTDIANSIIETSDGNLAVAGYTNSPDGDIQLRFKIAGLDAWLVKIDANTGHILWANIYGGYDGADIANSIISSRDGNLVFASYTGSSDGDIQSGNNGEQDFWVTKIDVEDGNIIWEKTFGGTLFDRATSIIETSDGNFAVTGNTNSYDGDVQSGYKGVTDYWVIKIFNNEVVLQSDVSDSLFAIVAPEFASKDIDMKQALVGTLKDSIISNFIQNTGSWDFSVDSIYFEGADADVFSLVSGIPKYIVETNNSHFAEIRFAPTEARIFSSIVVIITQSDTLKINIKGEGIEQRLDVINKIIDFGLVEMGEYKDTIQVLTIKNIGSSPITIKETKHNLPNDIDFSTLAGGGNFTLLPNETHLMDLRFEPSNIGRTNGTLEFHYDGIGSPALIQLFGEGIGTKPIIQSSFSPFPNLVCEDDITNQLEIKNIGVSRLIISSINIIGDDASDFSINETLPITILQDNSYILNINFASNSAGQKTAEVEIKSNSEVDSVLTIPLSARKDLINFAVQNSIDLGILCPDENKTFEIEVSNLGTIESYIDISIDSDISTQLNQIRFSIKQTNNIQFEFTGISQAGAFNREISIIDSCGKIHQVAIFGTIENPIIEFENLDFISSIGVSKQQNIEIRNNSNRTITINNIDGIQAPFSIVGNPYPLEITGNSSNFITIEFNPIDDNTILQELTAEIEQCNFIETFEITGTSSDTRIRLKTVEISAFVGEEITIPIILDLVENLNISGVATLDFDLVFNPTLLAPLDYEMNIMSDNIAITHFSDIPINEIEGSTLLNIKFIAGLGNAEFCDLKLTNLKLNGGIAEITAIDGKFNLLGICDEGGTRLINLMVNDYVLNISPNPSYGNVEISINLLEKGSKSLKIYDYNGILIEEFDLSNDLGTIDLNINTLKYANSLYFIHLQTPTIIKREKLIINR